MFLPLKNSFSAPIVMSMMIKDLQTLSGIIPIEQRHRKLDLSYGNNKGTDQPAYPCRLISDFVIRCLESIITLFDIHKFSRFYLLRVTAKTQQIFS